MPTAKMRASSTPNVMKSENRNDAPDTSSRQAIEREPFLSFTRAADNQFQWMKMLHGPDPQDITGWPLLSSLKVQMQKCDKCSLEFCSSINYRRHLRVHHRLKKLDKDTAKNRELIAAFWDKLSADDAKDIASFTNANLEEVPGSSLVKALTSLVHKYGFSLPPVCVKAGSSLLNIVQGRSKFPLSSEVLLSILDDASEKTFLCGMTSAVQKYIIDGEAGKICLETKNVVACSSFLLEQNLVKAWIAHQDAEALKCQKLLVEEEEAAQKRQAAVLERKRQKKLRQKEQKAKDQNKVEKLGVKESTDDTLEAEPPAETPSPSTASDSEIKGEDITSASEPNSCSQETDDGANDGAVSGFSNAHTVTGICDEVEHGSMQADDGQQGVARLQVPPQMQQGLPNGFHANHDSQGLKFGVMQKQGNQKEDLRTSSVAGGSKVWSRKPKSENDNYNRKTKAHRVANGKIENCKSSEVLIGSIPVSLGNKNNFQGCNYIASGKGNQVHQMKKNIVHIRPIKSDSIQSGIYRQAAKLWRPVSRNGTKDQVPVQNSDKVLKADMISGKNNDQVIYSGVGINREAGSNSLLQEEVHTGSLKVSLSAARAFLAQRWKEAIDSDHEMLVLSADPDINDDRPAPESSSIDVNCSILSNAESHSINFGSHEPLANGTHRSRFIKKHDKGVKIKYVAKQRAVT